RAALEGARPGREPRGAREDARARREGVALPHVGLRQGRQASLERRHVRRGLRRDGDRQGHRLFFCLRTSYDPIFWQGPRRVHAAQEDRRALEDPTARRDVQPPAAGAGAAHDPDREHAQRGAPAARRGGGHGGHPPVYADARGGEAELEGGHLRDARLLPRPARDAGRVHGADQVGPGAPDLTEARRALEEQVALVTGAGRGIGRAIAIALATEGAAVVLAARTRQQLAEVAAEIRERGGRALAVPTDVTQDTAVEALVEQTMAEFGRLDVLVTGAWDTPLWDAIPQGPDRSRMLRPEDVARAAVLMVTLPPSAALEELTLLPAAGIL